MNDQLLITLKMSMKLIKSNKFENLTFDWGREGVLLSRQSSVTYKAAREDDKQNQASLLIPLV